MIYRRNDFSSGWQPCVDRYNGPKNGFLRMDNLCLDQRGSLKLRPGIAKDNPAAFADTDVHSLYTEHINGTRYRFAGAGSHVYVNQTSTGTSIAGTATEHISFGSHMGQVFYTRSTTHKKHDGTTERNWGIAAPGAAPTLSALAADFKVFASGDSTDTPCFTLNEGTATGNQIQTITNATNASPIVVTTTGAHGLNNGDGIAISGVLGNLAANGYFIIKNKGATTFELTSDGTTNVAGNGAYTSGGIVYTYPQSKAAVAYGSIEVTPDSTTGRGTITKTYSAATDFTSYSGGQTGTDDDLIDFYCFINEPQYFTSLTLMIDVNDGTFQEDYYYYTFTNGDLTEVPMSGTAFLASDYTVEGYDRDNVLANREDRGQLETEFRVDKPFTDIGFNHFSVPRGNMLRVGQTAGKNWATVKAVRMTFVGTAGGSAQKVRFDAVQITGGSQRLLTGRYKACVVAVRNDNTYTAKSPHSAFSSEIELKANGLRLTLDATTVNNLDSQVNELWAFIMGGTMNAFYRGAVKTGGPFSGSQTIDITVGDRAMMIADIRMGTDDQVPPNDIIDIAGPHYDRLFCLTSTTLYPSRQLNPDSFSSGEAVTIGSATEKGLWVRKVNNELYVGTTKDIYRLSGTWTVNPDGSLDVLKMPIGLGSPPSRELAVAVEGGLLSYLADDGWRLLAGNQSQRLVDDVDLLYKGQSRYGVEPVNVANGGRFRAAMCKGQLVVITPEGATTTTSSQVMHRFDFMQRRWYRYTYTPYWRSVFVEPDGILIAGDSAGFVRLIDQASTQDDGSTIPVVLWTMADDDNQPIMNKDAQNFILRLNTEGDTANIAFHLNGLDTSNATTTSALTLGETLNYSLASLSSFYQIQLRITGSFDAFVLSEWLIDYLSAPPSFVLHDTGFTDVPDYCWVREVRVKARASSDLALTLYLDGNAQTTQTLGVAGQANTPYVYRAFLPREAHGRVPRVVISSDESFQVFWVELHLRTTGTKTQKRVVRVGEGQ